MTPASTAINYVVVIVLALVSSTGGWAFLQFIFNRRGAKAVAAKEEAEAESTREQAAKVREERIALLQDVAQKAYEAAEASADRRYRNLEEDYDTCRAGLKEVREAVRPLLLAIEAIMAHVGSANGDAVTLTVTRAEIATVTAAINEARHHLT